MNASALVLLDATYRHVHRLSVVPQQSPAWVIQWLRCCLCGAMRLCLGPVYAHWRRVLSIDVVRIRPDVLLALIGTTRSDGGIHSPASLTPGAKPIGELCLGRILIQPWTGAHHFRLLIAAIIVIIFFTYLLRNGFSYLREEAYTYVRTWFVQTMMGCWHSSEVSLTCNTQWTQNHLPERLCSLNRAVVERSWSDWMTKIVHVYRITVRTNRTDVKLIWWQQRRSERNTFLKHSS